MLPHMPMGRGRYRKDPRRPKFNPEAYPCHRDSTKKFLKKVKKITTGKTQQMLGKREIIIFRVTTFLNSNVQFLTTKKITRHTKKQKIWPIQGKKLSQQKLYLKKT